MAQLNRRELLQLFTVASLSAPLALAAPDPGAPLYFSKDEFALLDTLTELIIPADDHSPGAHAAGVAAYIDKSVAEAFLPEEKTSWRKGLAEVNRLSHSMHGKTFLAASQEQQSAVLKRMSTHEDTAESDDADSHGRKRNLSQAFFGQLKDTAIFAYYTSSIGIHQDIEYKGNVILEQFVGYMPDQPLPPISSLGTS
ncbi:MAG TPA: gluconate 2-dehydrogenase subunit 3 family protein [Bryobacteraceae bacterium]|jgi:hypothetical protein|nr:gluconate 2-dehydrogenase subunit 3 family protein [Bryobacteraceae bacterium]